MSVRINLLPHREERRKRQRHHFVALMVFFVGGALAVWGAGHVVLAGYMDTQTARNEFLKRENAKLDKEIEAVKRLKDDIAALLARKQIIEALQTDRSRSVELLDQVARQTPEGIYLKTMRQEGLKVTVVGYAQSNARVSTLMRNIESTGLFDQPTLLEIKAAEVDKKRLSEFSLVFAMKANQPDDAGKAPAPVGGTPMAATGNVTKG
jgi:type IV pilus assembly protein PilN